MKYKLKEKEVDVVSWNDEESQKEAIKQLEKLGCTDIKVTSSGAGIAIEFKYPTPNSHRIEYNGCLFCATKMVFNNDGEYPVIYSSNEFEELFEESTNTDLKFGEALEAVKEGKLIARKDWIDKGMFVFMRPSDTLTVDTIVNNVKSLPKALKDYYIANYAFSIEEEEQGDSPKYHNVTFTAYLCLKAADGSIVNGWTPNTLDLLAEDWCILD